MIGAGPPGAQALGESIRDLRHSQGNDGLIGYDLAWLTFAAQGLHTVFPAGGYDGHAQTYATIIGNDLVSPTPLFDMEDGSEAFYTDGLSWSLLALHATDLLTESQGDLKELILATQLESGAWGFNDDFPEPDLQSTAGALLALRLAGTGADRPERRAAIRYLVDQQTEDGGWDYAPGDESPLANADVLFALGRARELPAEPEALGRSAAAFVSAAPRASRALSTPVE